jgi:alanyl aminopeptidase
VIFGSYLSFSALICGPLFAAAPSFLLPNDVVPLKHAVELTVDPSRDTFEGRMRIEVELRAPVTEVWVNGKDLVVKSASLNGTPHTVLGAGGEFIGLDLGTPVEGRAMLEFRYQGRLDEKGLAGPYRRKVANDWYAFTTFTPIDARRAFPCFDEPRFKTPWEISIRTRNADRTFSNGRQIEETPEVEGWKLSRFATTEPLPAEIVAFAVGPFDVLDGGIAGAATPVRVITARGHAAEGQAAARATTAVLPRLEAYTGIPYPFGKLDHIALPAESFGAVENPGLITYRSQALLAAPGQDSAEKTRAIRRLQAHEIGHQWFGNLVTQADWQEVWLSEGFATWLSAKMMDQEEPPERAHLAAITARQRIMAVDASPNTRPVRLAVSTRKSAGDVYNRMVYDKAASVLMMLEAWLGEEPFRKGLQMYLAAHRNGNATADDLAESLRGASGLDPAAVMHAFLDTTGVPGIRVEVDCTREKLRIVPTGSAPVPVCWRTDGTAPRCDVVDKPATEVDLDACPAWVYPNARGTGYYRTVWTTAQLRALNPDRLTPAERLSLAYDLRAQQTDRAAAAAMLKKLAADKQPEIAKAARDGVK